MILIHKLFHRTKEIEETKLSAYNYGQYSILDTTNLIQSVEIETGIFENQIIIPDSKYIEGLSIVGSQDSFDIVEIIEMTQEQKDVVNANTAEQDFISSFKGYSFKIKIRQKLLKSNGKFKGFTLDLIPDSPKKDKVWEDNKKYNIVYLDYLSINDGFSLVGGIVLSPDEEIVLFQNPTHEFEIRELDEEQTIIQKSEEL